MLRLLTHLIQILNSIAQSDAEYTAAIAIDGKRDSIAVKTISVLGIVFLPGTFMATLFDVGMFDWKATDNEGQPSLRVSSSMWIYWAATLPLTAVTILAWLFWSWKEMSRTSKRLMTHRVLSPKESSSLAVNQTCATLLSENIV